MITPVSLNKLSATAELLRQRVEVKPGKLMVLYRLCHEQESSQAYLRFLLEAAGRDLPDISLVRQYFFEANELLGEELGLLVHLERLKIIARKLQGLQPGWKRIYVHASRRHVKYVDLYLLECIIKGLISDKRWTSRYYCYEASKLFVFDYDNMRYRCGDKALPRWIAITNYWVGQA